MDDCHELMILIADRNENEVVSSLNELYPVGTFVQIFEFQDFGNRARMILMGHRRIRISRVLNAEEQEMEKEEDGALSKDKRKKWTNWRKRVSTNASS